MNLRFKNQNNMLRITFRQISRNLLIDTKISKLRGTFDKRTPYDLLSVFKFDYRNPSCMENLELPESSFNSLSQMQQDFLYNSLYSYNRTHPAEFQVTKEFDEF